MQRLLVIMFGKCFAVESKCLVWICLIVATLAWPLLQCPLPPMHVCVCVPALCSTKLVPALKQLLGQLITTPWRNAVSLSTSSSVSLSFHLQNIHFRFMSVCLLTKLFLFLLYCFVLISYPYLPSTITSNTKILCYLRPSSYIYHHTHRNGAQRTG